MSTRCHCAVVIVTTARLLSLKQTDWIRPLPRSRPGRITASPHHSELTHQPQTPALVQQCRIMSTPSGGLTADFRSLHSIWPEGCAPTDAGFTNSGGCTRKFVSTAAGPLYPVSCVGHLPYCMPASHSEVPCRRAQQSGRWTSFSPRSTVPCLSFSVGVSKRRLWALHPAWSVPDDRASRRQL